MICPVKDLDQAEALYGALLGVAPYADEPYHVGFRVGEQELGLDPRGHSRGVTGPTGYWEVDDIEERLRSLRDAGAEVRQPVTDVGRGKLIATVADPDGNITGLVQSPDRLFPATPENREPGSRDDGAVVPDQSRGLRRVTAGRSPRHRSEAGARGVVGDR